MAGGSRAVQQDDANDSRVHVLNGAADKRGSGLAVEHVDVGAVRIGCQTIKPRPGRDGLPALGAAELAFQYLGGRYTNRVEVVAADTGERTSLKGSNRRRLSAAG